jgi:Raf kinase inhibitor-like YbhB/YbcL family protein
MGPAPEDIAHTRRARGAEVVTIALLLCLLAVAIKWLPHFNRVEGKDGAALEVESTSFSNGGIIPGRYTCDGASLSPELHWTAAPAGTKSFALVMDDPDALDFTHWIAYNIRPDARELAEGASRSQMSQGSAEGANSYGAVGYAGPCPPPGKPHHYVFRVFALDRSLALPAGAARGQVNAAMKGHVLAEGRTTGLYQR